MLPKALEKKLFYLRSPKQLEVLEHALEGEARRAAADRLLRRHAEPRCRRRRAHARGAARRRTGQARAAAAEHDTGGFRERPGDPERAEALRGEDHRSALRAMRIFFPRSQILFGNAFLLPAKFHFAVDKIGNGVASARAFPSTTWERG
ncbi:MAG: hypothetical protein WDO13_19615 [Verrucomicrobiota bacterium]